MDKNTLRSELKAFELFEQKLEEIDKKIKTKSKVHSLNIEGI